MILSIWGQGFGRARGTGSRSRIDKHERGKLQATGGMLSPAGSGWGVGVCIANVRDAKPQDGIALTMTEADVNDAILVGPEVNIVWHTRQVLNRPHEAVRRVATVVRPGGRSRHHSVSPFVSA